MKNIKISTGLVGIIAMFTLMLVLACGLGLKYLKYNNVVLKNLDVNANEQKALKLTRDAITHARTIFNSASTAKIYGEQYDIRNAQREMQDQLRNAAKQFGIFQTIPGLSNTHPEIGDKIQKAYDAQIDALKQNAERLTSFNDPQTFKAAIEGNRANLVTLRANWDKEFLSYIEATQNKVNEYVQNGNDSYRFAVLVMSVLLSVAVILFFTTLIWLRRTLVRPLKVLAGHFDAIGKGDLTGDIQIPNRNEVGLLSESLQEMQAGLRETVTSIRQGAESINIGTQEIASGNGDLSSRTEQQAAAVVETAASMEQISSTVKLNTDNARQASEMFRDTASVASEGETQMLGMREKMNVISQSAQKMVEIISVIDGIAFQTNILALNAAVEAARAGQSGRGFAVVAGEVRNLAKRCTDSAKEITVLINESTQYIEEGTELAEKTSRVIIDISSAVSKANVVMENIAQASEEQNRGVEQIRVAITQMDEVTQQNAALVEEVATTAQGVESQANELSRAVSTFRLSSAH
ncbi:methyl-accepting chemotaxis protein [Enterobacteriaceae bacterium H16N7]|nr:methyl-accepting chemotaxis protein [Dryocola clanedunensis]